MAIIISGTDLAKKLREEMTEEVVALKEQGIIPGLAVIIVGENPASMSYVMGKQKAADAIGIAGFTKKLSEDITEEELLKFVEKYNQDDSIHGILVQLPLPKHINEEKIVNTIIPEKDVDGFHPMNVGNMMLGKDCFLPCTPHGVIKMLESIDCPTEGKHVVVIGRSNIVGKPMANLLLRRGRFGNATVTVCHSGTKNLKEHTLQADILIPAVGKPNLITADMVKEGSVIIDVAVNRVEDATRKRGFRLVGDVDFEGVQDKVHAISKVPGGVGPMTITMLMRNTIDSAMNYSKI